VSRQLDAATDVWSCRCVACGGRWSVDGVQVALPLVDVAPAQLVLELANEAGR
jgi:hypothetical protein